MVRRPPFSKIFFSKTAWPIKTKFHMEPQWDGGTQVCSRGLVHMGLNDDPRLTLTYFTARSNLVPYAFIWGKLVRKSFNGRKLTANDQSDKRFMLKSKF